MIDEEKLKEDIYIFNKSKEKINGFGGKESELTYKKMEEDIKLLYTLWNTLGGVLSIKKEEADLETVNPRQTIKELNSYQEINLSYIKETSIYNNGYGDKTNE